MQIKHNSTLRRVSLAKGLPLTYSALQKKIYELFSLSAENSLTLTYVDNEGDVVTIADDSDVTDAVVHQGLNPLRLEVHSESKRVAPGSAVSSTRKIFASAEASPSLIVRSELVKQAEVVEEVSERKEGVAMFMICKCPRGVVLGIGGIANAAGTGMVTTEDEPQAMITTHQDLCCFSFTLILGQGCGWCCPGCSSRFHCSSRPCRAKVCRCGARAGWRACDSSWCPV